MNTVLFKLKLILTNTTSAIWSSPISIAVLCIFFFLFTLLGFSLVYWFVFHWQNINATSYDGKTYVGRLSAVPAFSFSESFKTTLKINAVNDLRLQKFGDQVIQNSWMGFSEDKSIYRQFGKDPETPDELKLMSRLGTTPLQLVDEQFEKYKELKVKLSFKGNELRNTNVDHILIPVMMEYFREPSGTAMSDRVFNAKMSTEELKLYSKLQSALQVLAQQVFRDQETTLGGLKNAMQMAYEKLIENESFPEIIRLKSIFYGEVLNNLALYNVQMSFDLNSLYLRPRFVDFIYMSTMVATNNVPSEITPVTDNVRFIIWLQMMLSYFNLALIVSAIVRILKI